MAVAKADKRHARQAAALPMEQALYVAHCPLLYALEVMGGKWKIPIVWFLYGNEEVRYNELKRRVRGITSIMLTKCLRELENADIVRRKQYDEIPPHVAYSLTENGEQLIPVLKKLCNWGEKQVAWCNKKQ